MFVHSIVALTLISLVYSSFNQFALLEYEAINEDLSPGFHENIMALTGALVQEIKPLSVALILDSIFFDYVSLELIESLDQKMVTTLVLKDSENFEVEPSEKVQQMFHLMRNQGFDLYIFLVSNGFQMSNILRYADLNRILKSGSKLILLHDYRLFSYDMLYVWRRRVNTIFISECEKKLLGWYELSTIPYPVKLTEVLITRVVNYWTRPNHFRWKRKIFDHGLFKNNGRDITLKVAVLQHTPSVTRNNDSEKKKYRGLEIDLIQSLSEIMRFSIDLYEPVDVLTEKWGHDSGNRNFSGLLGEMDNVRADIALGNLYYTQSNLEVMDLTTPYLIECLTFITPEILNDNSWRTLISPFSLGMWTGVLISMAIIGIIFFLFSNFYTVIRSHKSSAARKTDDIQAKDFFDLLPNCILYTYSMLLLVSLPRLPLRWSVRVLTGWWWIYCLLVVVAYRASLTSILANPQPRVTIDTLDVLAKSWLKCGSWGDQSRGLFGQSEDESAKLIGAKLEHVEDASEAVSFFPSL